MFATGVSTIILASVILFAIIAIMARTTNKWQIKRTGKRLPGPPRWPLIGNTFFLTRKMEDLLDVFTWLFDSYPAICQMWIGPKMLVAINDPDFSKIVLADYKLLHRSYVDILFKGISGTGLIAAQPATWRVHRRIVGPVFTSTSLRPFIDVFDTQSKILVEQLEVHQDGPEFDMEHHISSCMLDIIIETTMNVKLGTQTNQNLKFKRATDSVIEIASQRLFRPWLHPEFFFHLSSLGARYAECTADARGFARRVMKEQMEGMISQCPEVVDHGEQAETPSIQESNLLNLLMNWNNGEVKLPNEDIIDELITIAVTATDTTTTATNMLMLALASYPDVQQKVYEEVTEICGVDDGRTMTVNQLNDLVYLERVIKEILRLFPVASFVARDAIKDMTIGDYHVPKGAVVTILVYALHRNGKVWPDPIKFDPDRFLPEEVVKRHPFAYMPFGAGPRNCVGSKHAMIAMKMICAKIVQKYALEKDHPKNIADTKMQFGIAIKPCDPVTVRIRRRQANIAVA